jgi:hypothetical protein
MCLCLCRSVFSVPDCSCALVVDPNNLSLEEIKEWLAANNVPVKPTVHLKKDLVPLMQEAQQAQQVPNAAAQGKAKPPADNSKKRPRDDSPKSAAVERKQKESKVPDAEHHDSQQVPTKQRILHITCSLAHARTTYASCMCRKLQF